MLGCSLLLRAFFLLSFFLWHGYDVFFFLFFFFVRKPPVFDRTDAIDESKKKKKKQKKKVQKQNRQKKKIRASGLTAWTAKRLILYTAVRSKGACLGVVYAMMNHG